MNDSLNAALPCCKNSNENIGCLRGKPKGNNRIIEAGLFDKPPVSPTPTPTQEQAQTEGATYSTEKNNVSDKEDIDEVSDS